MYRKSQTLVSVTKDTDRVRKSWFLESLLRCHGQFGIRMWILRITFSNMFASLLSLSLLSLSRSSFLALLFSLLLSLSVALSFGVALALSLCFSVRPHSLSLSGVDRFTTNTLGGLAIRDGKIMAMEGAPSGRLEMVGRLRVPEGHHWVGITLRDGHAMALDDKGALFELDVPSGNWSGPKAMHGILFWCVLSDGWLAVGQANGGDA